jgi:hypothetical protein
MLQFSVVLLQQIHCYAVGLLRYYGNATNSLLRYYGNAIWCIDHVTKENLICHNVLLFE